MEKITYMSPTVLTKMSVSSQMMGNSLVGQEDVLLGKIVTLHTEEVTDLPVLHRNVPVYRQEQVVDNILSLYQ